MSEPRAGLPLFRNHCDLDRAGRKIDYRKNCCKSFKIFSISAVTGQVICYLESVVRGCVGLLTLCGLALSLSGCEKLGLEDPAKVAEKIEAEGKAIGGACRHAGRAIEDCYAMNGRASKSAMFDGWREMNDYMLQNKIEVVKPVLVHAEESAAEKLAGAEAAKVEEVHEKIEVKHEEEIKPAVAEVAQEVEGAKEEKKPKRKRKVPRKEAAQEAKQEEPPATRHDPASGPIHK